MSESAMVEAAELIIYPNPAATMTEAGSGWFGKELAVMAARHAVTIWATAVNGDDSALAAMADIPERVPWLLLPESDHPWQPQWVVAPGPALTELTIWSLQPTADPPELGVQWWFTGRQRWLGTEPDGAGGHDGEEGTFVGMLTLAMTGAGSGDWPWQLTLGYVRTLDQFLGYTYASATETEDECRRRTGAEGPLAPTDDYLLVADFANHDTKFGATVSAEVSSDPAPTRDEAARLVEPAMQAECVRRDGGEIGDWYPSLNHLRVIRLLGPA